MNLTPALAALTADTVAATGQTVTHLADITDPTSDGILINLVNIGLSALMVIVALVGGWFAFKAWYEAKGKNTQITAIRDVAFGVLAVEAFLGGVMYIANYGSGLVDSLT